MGAFWDALHAYRQHGQKRDAKRTRRETTRLREIAEAQLDESRRRQPARGEQAAYTRGWGDGYAKGYQQGQADQIARELGAT